jgi:hypothetical protein
MQVKHGKVNIYQISERYFIEAYSEFDRWIILKLIEIALFKFHLFDELIFLVIVLDIVTKLILEIVSHL